jgi:pyroglutamyl-peptidase
VSGFLVTAFEPFGGRARNRSLDAVSRLARDGVETLVLPTVFAALPERVPPLVDACTHGLILVGESAAARRPVLERVALNLIDARTPDNAGAMPRDAPVVDGGPLAYRATWPAARLAGALASAGLPVDLSAHAGTFCCNAALYLALHTAAARRAAPAIGFLHVPARSRFADDLRAARTIAFLVEQLAKSVDASKAVDYASQSIAGRAPDKE